MLSFYNHISASVSSCMSKLSQINKSRLVFNKGLLETIINMLFFSKLYHISSACNVQNLQYVQNFAMRIIWNLKKYDHIFSVLRNLCWLPVKTNYLDATLTFICMRDQAPEYLTSKLVTRGSVSGCITRNAHELNVPCYKTASGQKTLHYSSGSSYQAVTGKIYPLKQLFLPPASS